MFVHTQTILIVTQKEYVRQRERGGGVRMLNHLEMCLIKYLIIVVLYVIERRYSVLVAIPPLLPLSRSFTIIFRHPSSHLQQ